MIWSNNYMAKKKKDIDIQYINAKDLKKHIETPSMNVLKSIVFTIIGSIALTVLLNYLF
tara:strand:- start:565 stop:741 length:177 start_codon:yes stop_codon:yes gene_type:complete